MPRYTFRPLTRAEWQDLEDLFGPRGACGGCWCMWWRLTRAAFNAAKGKGNRGALKRLVDSGTVPGSLAYEGGRPVGWCSIAPRDHFPALDRSRVLARVDVVAGAAAATKTATCFFMRMPPCARTRIIVQPGRECNEVAPLRQSA